MNRADPPNAPRVATRLSAAEIAWPAAIGLVALVIRLAFALQYARHPLGRLPWVDEGAYLTRAQAIHGGAWLPERPYFQDPLFPYVLAGLVGLVGFDVARLRVALACLGALTPVAVYWAGRRGLGRGEGVVAGLLAAFCGPWVFTDGQLEKESLAALLAALALVAISGAGRARNAFLGGAAWGCVALLRANALILAPLGAVWVAAIGGGERSRRTRLRAAACYLAGFALVLSPVTVVNVLRSHPRQLILTTWQLGPNFYIGNGPGATGTYAAPDFIEANPSREADDFAAEASRRAGRRLTETEVSRFWLRAGLKRWHDAPAASLRLLGHKVALLVNDREVPDNQDFEAVRLLAAPRVGWAPVSFGVLLPLAALGLGRGARGPFWWFLVLCTAAGLASTAAYFIVGRYRVPWLPALTLLAATGLVDAVQRVASRRWASLAGRLLVLGVPAAVASWWPLDDPAPDRWGHQEIALAFAYLNDGQLGAAVDARALGERPAARVAAVLAAGPVHDRIASLIAVRWNLPPPPGVAPDVERARLFRQLPESRDRARRLLEERLRAFPDDRNARRELGAWWLGPTGDPAASAYARAELGRAPADLSASLLLALLTDDPSRLPPAAAVSSARQTRLRLARAILAAAGERKRRRGTKPDLDRACQQVR